MTLLLMNDSMREDTEAFSLDISVNYTLLHLFNSVNIVVLDNDGIINVICYWCIGFTAFYISCAHVSLLQSQLLYLARNMQIIG